MDAQTYRTRSLSFHLNLLISLTPTSDHLLELLLPSEIQSQDFTFSPFGGWQGGSGSREPPPNENIKQTAINHRSLVPRRRLARGNFPQMLQYLYTPYPKYPHIGGFQTYTSPDRRHSGVGVHVHDRVILD